MIKETLSDKQHPIADDTGEKTLYFVYSEECIELHNSHRKELNLENCWFFIEQSFEFNKSEGSVARFCANSGRDFLICCKDPSVAYSSLGVRFCRKISRSKK
jgi:hypothetical protein